MKTKFINLIKLPFNEWDAFKTGIISENGCLLALPKTKDEIDSYGDLEQYTRTLKVAVEYGQSQLAFEAFSELRNKFSLDEFRDYSEEDFKCASILEDMVAGDSSGDPGKIAAGETSGSITGKGPGINRKKKK